MTKIKRLFFDIEVSPNVIFSWNVGRKINVGYENILKERAIICICWKWEGSSVIHSLKWDNGKDKKLIQDFVNVLLEADEVVGHNGDNFDLKWVRTRCLLHNVKSLPEFKSIDTLKIARKRFRFNSNRLDYIAKFLGLGAKISTGFDLWKNICLNNSKKAMNEMVRYCKADVILLEKVYNKLSGFDRPATNVAVMVGNDRWDCPHCGNMNTNFKRRTVSPAGLIKCTMYCYSGCQKYYTISLKAFNDREASRREYAKLKRY